MAHICVAQLVTVCGIIISPLFMRYAYSLELETRPDESMTCNTFQLATCNMPSTTEQLSDKTTNTNNTTLVISSYYVNLRRGMYVYSIPVIFMLGLPGNILSFIIMTKKHNRHISCCVFMSSLAVTDTLDLFAAALYWVLQAFNIKRSTATHFLININHYIFVKLGYLTLIAMTVDRMIAVRYPLKATVLCIPKRAMVYHRTQ